MTCECCKTIFEVETKDFIIEKVEIPFFDNERNIYKVYVQCPVCNTYNRVKFIQNNEVKTDENRNN